jgi:DNA-binding XRE family transcriptional regulator
MENRLPNYIRAERRKAGLSQREIGLILGYNSEKSVSKHELNSAMPPLLIALAYSVLFEKEVSELFGGLQNGVASVVEKRIGDLENNLVAQWDSGKDRSAAAQHKLEWIKGRCRSEDGEQNARVR